jgi:tetratricopeptide (TPR) repeat protein
LRPRRSPLEVFPTVRATEGWDAHLDALAVAIAGHPISNINAKDERSENDKLIAGLKTRAEAFHYAGDYERADRLWDAVLDLEGDSAITWHNKGNAYRRLGRYDDALNAYEKSLSLNPDQPDTLYNKGNTLAELGRPGEAITFFDKALALSPGDEAIKKRRQILVDNN